MNHLASPSVASLLVLFSIGHVRAQTTRTDLATEPVHEQSCAKQPGHGDPRISWVRLVPDIGCDQKRIWTFPARLVRGHAVVPTAAIIGMTAALVASDAQTEGPLRTAKSFHTFNQIFSSTNTGLIIGLVPGALYVTGLVTHDTYAKNTVLLAAEAAADVEIVDLAVTATTHRLRPRNVAPGGNLSDTWFEYGKVSVIGGSFPSGHAIASFAIATVMARRYSNRRWVPWVAYGVAGLIGFSRLPLGAHFPSDVFMGAALGYTIGRFVVVQ
jgi:membrane-associated phospholipid phosphatase